LETRWRSEINEIHIEEEELWKSVEVETVRGDPERAIVSESTKGTVTPAIEQMLEFAIKFCTGEPCVIDPGGT
jgi:hypothetical protein